MKPETPDSSVNIISLSPAQQKTLQAFLAAPLEMADGNTMSTGQYLFDVLPGILEMRRQEAKTRVTGMVKILAQSAERFEDAESLKLKQELEGLRWKGGGMRRYWLGSDEPVSAANAHALADHMMDKLGKLDEKYWSPHPPDSLEADDIVFMSLNGAIDNAWDHYVFMTGLQQGMKAFLSDVCTAHGEQTGEERRVPSMSLLNMKKVMGTEALRLALAVPEKLEFDLNEVNMPTSRLERKYERLQASAILPENQRPEDPETLCKQLRAVVAGMCGKAASPEVL